MSEKPKRSWFQFHLLTLVLMALAAGIMIGSNRSIRLHANSATYTESGGVWREDGHAYFAYCCSYDRGWPFAYESGETYRVSKWTGLIEAQIPSAEVNEAISRELNLSGIYFNHAAYTEPVMSSVGPSESAVNYRALAFDAAILMLSCTGIGITSEFLRRRREARKT
jgi:hypothetical protein